MVYHPVVFTASRPALLNALEETQGERGLCALLIKVRAA
jgi:hypothetical protein